MHKKTIRHVLASALSIFPACFFLAGLAVPSLAFALNEPPVANAGGDRTMYTGDSITLSGTAYDPDGEPIVLWSWVVESAPSGSVWDLLPASPSTATFSAYTQGQYLISLIVESPSGGSAPDVATITVADNLPPVAIATADKTEGLAPLTVQFDASQSYDPEGKLLAEYFWDFGDGSMGSYAVTPAHTYSLPGTYLAILAVTDERGAVGSDVLLITAVPEPETYAMMLAGLGLVGFMAKRRKQVEA